MLYNSITCHSNKLYVNLLYSPNATIFSPCQSNVSLIHICHAFIPHSSHVKFNYAKESRSSAWSSLSGLSLSVRLWFWPTLCGFDDLLVCWTQNRHTFLVLIKILQRKTQAEWVTRKPDECINDTFVMWPIA